MQTTQIIDIQENETEVSISFSCRFGEIEITQMVNVETGESIAPDLLDELSNMEYSILIDKLRDYANDESIELENSYSNI